MSRKNASTPEFITSSHADEATYEPMYFASIADPDRFWAKHGKRIEWIKPFTKVKNMNFDHQDVSVNSLEDEILNVAANCIDRHLGRYLNFFRT